MLGRMRRTRELRSELFNQMMQRFGVQMHGDYAYPEGTALHTAAARCIHCIQAKRCKAWLAMTSGTEGAADFCPNAAFFTALAGRTAKSPFRRTEALR
ncbi:MAG: hypothetical protein IT539_00450 [Bradyrhizobiaceae bacterium]|nr:hypothetical protein [Bradyrhizobiaceae bacterium]